jgi:hypothetical protein
MTAKAILEEIKPLGRDSYKEVLLNHGVRDPCFEVKIEDLKQIQKRIKKDYRLNGFVIAVGADMQPLTALALLTGEKIGPVTVDMGNTACQVPFPPDYIRKLEKRGAIGKKRQSAKC